MYSDFQLVAFNELFHSCGKWRYLHGEEYKLPLVVRCAGGYSFGAGAEHSNIFECLFNHAPGLTIITPSNAYDAKGLLKAAIRSDNPVLFFEHKQLYKTKMEIPEEDYVLPIGKAEIKRRGTDVTIIAVGLMVREALTAADKLAAEGISCEVLDPRTILPFDEEAAKASVSKTHRCVIVERAIFAPVWVPNGPPCCRKPFLTSWMPRSSGSPLWMSPCLTILAWRPVRSPIRIRSWLRSRRSSEPFNRK